MAKESISSTEPPIDIIHEHGGKPCVELEIRLEEELLDQAALLWLRRHVDRCSRELLDNLLQRDGVEFFDCMIEVLRNAGLQEILREHVAGSLHGEG